MTDDKKLYFTAHEIGELCLNSIAVVDVLRIQNHCNRRINDLLAQLDRLTSKVAEAQKAQAHTASCNLELMRKLDKRDEALRFYADCKAHRYIEHGAVWNDRGAKAREALGEDLRTAVNQSVERQDKEAINRLVKEAEIRRKLEGE